jgi:hypothetical protein
VFSSPYLLLLNYETILIFLSFHIFLYQICIPESREHLGINFKGWVVEKSREKLPRHRRQTVGLAIKRETGLINCSFHDLLT